MFWNKMCNSKARLDGKVVVITGANTGIGLETAIDLAKRGASLILGCRNLEKAGEASDRITKETGVVPKIIKLDLNSLASVRQFAKETLAASPKINILINNAGIMMVPQSKTEDGFEAHFGTNHLGHFLLTLLLLDRIKESAPARIVTLSSLAHTYARSIDFDDLNMDNNYSPAYAYAQSKLANILFSLALSKRLEGTGVTVYSLHPGVVQTELGRNIKDSWNWIIGWGYNFFGRFFFKTPVQGAQTSIFCACSEDLENKTGRYYSDCAEGTPSQMARDRDLAEKLYKVSLKLVGLPEEK